MRLGDVAILRAAAFQRLENTVPKPITRRMAFTATSTLLAALADAPLADLSQRHLTKTLRKCPEHRVALQGYLSLIAARGGRNVIPSKPRCRDPIAQWWRLRTDSAPGASARRAHVAQPRHGLSSPCSSPGSTPCRSHAYSHYLPLDFTHDPNGAGLGRTQVVIIRTFFVVAGTRFGSRSSPRIRSALRALDMLPHRQARPS